MNSLELTSPPDAADIDEDPAAGEETAEDASATSAEGAVARERRFAGILVFTVLPAVVMLTALTVGYLKWQSVSLSLTRSAGVQAIAAATEGTTAMLSYRADHVEQDLTAASGYMTGQFQKEYSSLITEVVIPGAQQKRISAVATVPSAALLSANTRHAQVLVYINQTTAVGADPPTDSRSSARVDMEKVSDAWLMSGFEPI